MKNPIKFPLWFTVLSWLLVISNLLIFGLFSLIHPSLPWPELGETEAAFPIQFFAVRHIAFGVVLLHGLLKKNLETLKSMYHLFMIIAILDVVLLAINGYYIPVLVKFIGEVPLGVTVLISTIAFIIPMAISIRFLRGFKSTS